MDLDATAIDEQPVRGIVGAGQRAEDALPDAAFRPTDEAIVECLLRAIDVGAIDPTPTTAQGMDDPTQYTTVINASLAAHIGRQ
jgi:hypothetical protein